MTIEADPTDELRDACSGQPYRALVELYAVRHDPDGLEAQIRSVLHRFSPGTGRGAQRFYNLWNLKGQDREILDLDCREAMDRLVEDARRRLPGDPEGEDLLRAFRLVTLGLALTASLFPDARTSMGVRTAGELRVGRAEDEG